MLILFLLMVEGLVEEVVAEESVLTHESGGTTFES